MLSSLQSAQRGYYFVIAGCVAAWVLTLSPRRTATEDAALQELRAIETAIFPLRDPAAPWRLDSARVAFADCGAAFAASQRSFWNALRGDSLSLAVTGDTAWTRRAHLASTLAPHDGWTIGQIREAVEQNAGGACREADLAAVRRLAESVVRRCPACTAHQAALSAQGEADSARLALRWRASGADGSGIDTTAAVAMRTDVRYTREGLQGYLRFRMPDWFAGVIIGLDDRRDVGYLPALATFGPAVDTLAVRGARRYVDEKRREKLQQTTFLGITVDERLARALPLAILIFVLELGVALDHAVRVGRWSGADGAVLRTFSWTLLSHHPRVQPAAAFVVALLPALTVAALQARLTHLSLVSYRGAVAGIAVWSVAVLLASLWTNRKLDALLRIRPPL